MVVSDLGASFKDGAKKVPALIAQIVDAFPVMLRGFGAAPQSNVRCSSEETRARLKTFFCLLRRADQFVEPAVRSFYGVLMARRFGNS